MKASPDFPGGERDAPLPAPAAPAPAMVLAAARAQLGAWQRQHRRAVMAEELTRALVAGGLAAALAGGFCAAGLWPWATAGLTGAAATGAALLARRPWRRLPTAADTALLLERRENWQNALSTLLSLDPPAPASGPATAGKTLSPAARDFAAWLGPRLPRWAAARLPLRPANWRYLALPPCLIMAEWLLGQAAVATPGGAGDLPPGAAPAAPRIVATLPHAAAPENAPRLPTLAPDALPADARRPEAAPRAAPAPRTGAKSENGAGENAADGAASAAAMGATHGVFQAALPTLTPEAVLRRLENGAAAVPMPYRPVVSRYFAPPPDPQ